jgi:alanine dehydrogenase
MTPLLHLDAAEVASLLPVATCIELVDQALRAFARGETVQPLRSLIWLPDRRGLLGMMPGAMPAAPGGGLLGIKVVTVFHGNRERGEESHLGWILLFDDDLGKPLALLDAAAITALRTAAVSAVATRALARPEAGDLALLGAGVQASHHLAALLASRPLRRVRVWSRRPHSALEFAAREGDRHGIAIEPTDSAEQAVRDADLICTVTSAKQPVLAGSWLAPGAHVNAVGSCSPAVREIDRDVVDRSRVFVDARESALAEAGDLLLARNEGVDPELAIVAELGQVLIGAAGGRRSPDEITLFESLGLAVEDIATAGFVYRQALANGVGTDLAAGKANG